MAAKQAGLTETPNIASSRTRTRTAKPEPSIHQAGRLVDQTWCVDLWDERVGSSSAWLAVETARARVRELSEEHGSHDALGRASRVMEIVAARLRALDPDLAVPSLLESVGQRIEAATTTISSHLEPPDGANPASLDEVNAATDQVVQTLTSLPPAGNDEAVAVADVYRRELGGIELKVAEIVNEAREALAASTEEHTQTLAERQSEVARLKDQLTEIESSITTLRTTVEEFLAERTSAAEAAANEAKAAHDTQRQRAREDADALLSEAKGSFEEEATRERETHDELVASFKTTGETHLAEIEEMKEQVERLVGAVGRTGLSGGFQQWEASEREDADRMRRYAIGFGVAAALAVIALVIVRLFVDEASDGGAWALSLGALSIPAALGAVAVYAGRESGRHRTNQVIARRTELELASFGPYLAELEKTEQAELTALFAPVFFGQAMAHASGTDEDEPAGPQPLMKEVLDRLAEVIKQRRSGSQ